MFDWNSLIYYLIVIAVTALAAWLLTCINRLVFKRINSQRGTRLHVVFMEKINTAIIIFGCSIVGLSFLGGIGSLWKSVLGGTAVITAVAVFAAQDTIKDILAGIMISTYKPFEIGNRVELEGGTSGIIKDITMRHVVIHTWGSQEMIIPNSRLNSLIILNDSYHTHTRSYQAYFHIGYGSDVKKAMGLIKQAVIDCPYTVEGKKNGESVTYDEVYFMSYEESSLLMATTVYYNSTPTEAVKSDINTRVNDYLKSNGIEVPYPYVNVVSR